MDRDLTSIAEARALAKRAKQAWLTLAEFSQEQIDAIVDAMAHATAPQATARLVNRRGVDGAPIPVVDRGEGRFEIDLPLSNIAAGEWLLAIDAASGEDRAQVMLPFRIAQ